MYRLYAYADSSDLIAHEAKLVRAFSDFAATWPVTQTLLTNKKAPLMEGQELPDWNLGLRINAPELSREDVEQLLSFLAQLSREVSLPFVVGTWRERKVGTTDLCLVDRHAPDGAAGLILEGSNVP
ncbi:MAG: hypothetical protein ABL891_17585 [Burkholderiales bacterium]